MKICVPIQAKSIAELKKALQAARAAGADLVEVWLDGISVETRLIASLQNMPFVAVCKKSPEQGRFKGTYCQVAEVLEAASLAGAAYIDISHRMPVFLAKKLIKHCRLRSKIIISYHRFDATPSFSFLRRKALALKKRGADVVKIATQAKSTDDALTLLRLAVFLKKHRIRHIVIGMGEYGKITRMLTSILGSEMMFAPLTSHFATAPGQMTVEELQRLQGLQKLQRLF